MVVVNFRVVVAPADQTPRWIDVCVSSLEGRAAALFVMLAGIGLGLASDRHGIGFRRTLLKRAAFLMVIGLLNSLVFPADILHYYAVYFLIGAACIRLPAVALWALSAGIVLLFPMLLFIFDYEKHWDWSTLSYEGFWTFDGFVRNLLYNGWHPAIPWSAFVLAGMAISRLRLDRRRTQLVLLVVSASVAAGTEFGAAALQHAVPDEYRELRDAFLTTSVIPPTPLYMIASAATAMACVGAVLLMTPWLHRLHIARLFARTGRQTLTLYIAHILLGMGVLDYLGKLESGDLTYAFNAAAVFCILSIISSNIWAIRFRHGPLEWLMRRMSMT